MCNMVKICIFRLEYSVTLLRFGKLFNIAMIKHFFVEKVYVNQIALKFYLYFFKYFCNNLLSFHIA